MAVKKSTDGKWMATYSKRHPITRIPITRRKKGLSSKAEAKRAYDDLVLRVNEIIKGDLNLKWPAFLDKYFVFCEKSQNYTQKTIYDMEKCLRSATEEKWSNKYVNEIYSEDIREIIKEDLKEKSQSHQKSMLKFIRGAFNYAVELRQAPSNPTPNNIKFKIGGKLNTVLTKQQASLLLKKAKEHDWDWYPHYAMALYTGMRSGELYALRWSNVDLSKRRIKVDTAWNSKDGFKSTKSNYDRNVEIAKPLIPLLAELAMNKPSDDFVLPRSSKWDKGEQARELRAFLNMIGLPRIRFHDLRATWATLLLAQGKEPALVMKMAGWNDLKTMNYYCRLAGIDVEGVTSDFSLE